MFPGMSERCRALATRGQCKCCGVPRLMLKSDREEQNEIIDF